VISKPDENPATNAGSSEVACVRHRRRREAGILNDVPRWWVGRVHRARASGRYCWWSFR